MNEDQEKFLNDFDLIQIHLKIQQRHIDFLKTIDPENQSNAIRLVIDKYMKQTKMIIMERYLLWVVFGISIILFVSLVLPLL